MTAPALPEPGSEEHRKRMENAARDVFNAADDAYIVEKVVHVLTEVARLVPHLPRLKEIVENPNHGLFVAPGADTNPAMRDHLAAMRRAQVGAILHVMRVIRKTQVQTIESAPAIHREGKRIAIENSLKRLGIEREDKGQGDVR